MSLFSWLRPAGPALTTDVQQRLAQLPTIGQLSECSLREQRWVVLDLELYIVAGGIEDGAVD